MIDANDLELADLPQSLVDVVDVVGMAAALSLVERAGGTRIYVPETMDAEHKLSLWLGVDAAATLSEHFGGEALDVPRCLAGMRAVRDRRIRAQRQAGARANELALQYRLTERQVYSILAAEDDVGRQQSFL